MNEMKNDCLYLTIKQTFFDQIIAGTKKEEYRDITPSTYKKYLDCGPDGFPDYDDEILTPEDIEFYDADLLMACKDGKFPFFFREDIKFLNLAVGYSKERDTATVEVTSIIPQILEKPNGESRFNFGANGEPIFTPDGLFCMWQAVFHLGKVIEVHRKGE